MHGRRRDQKKLCPLGKLCKKWDDAKPRNDACKCVIGTHSSFLALNRRTLNHTRQITFDHCWLGFVRVSQNPFFSSSNDVGPSFAQSLGRQKKGGHIDGRGITQYAKYANNKEKLQREIIKREECVPRGLDRPCVEPIDFSARGKLKNGWGIRKRIQNPFYGEEKWRENTNGRITELHL